jgi:phosphatidylserine synthase
MTTAAAREFFLGAASVAGALIGLLFVALSVAPERVLGPDASEVHTVRAAATLTAFTNALTVSLFGLVPELDLGGATTVVAAVGLLFVAGSLLRVLPFWRSGQIKLREVSFLLGLIVVFVFELLAGIGLLKHTHDRSDLQTVCILVAVCFLIGVARAWELVGGPSVTFTGQVAKRARSHRTPDRGGARDAEAGAGAREEGKTGE